MLFTDFYLMGKKEYKAKTFDKSGKKCQCISLWLILALLSVKGNMFNINQGLLYEIFSYIIKLKTMIL